MESKLNHIVLTEQSDAGSNRSGRVEPANHGELSQVVHQTRTGFTG
jgi:hypothetical protein